MATQVKTWDGGKFSGEEWAIGNGYKYHCAVYRPKLRGTLVTLCKKHGADNILVVKGGDHAADDIYVKALGTMTLDPRAENYIGQVYEDNLANMEEGTKLGSSELREVNHGGWEVVVYKATMSGTPVWKRVFFSRNRADAEAAMERLGRPGHGHLHGDDLRA